MRTVSCLIGKLMPLIVGIIFTLQANCSYAAEYFIGVSAKWGRLKGEEEATGFDVAEMTSDTDLGLVLSVKSKDSYFKNSSFGYFIELGMSSYKIDKDVSPGPAGDNTGLEGQYLYLTPTAFYDFFKNNPDDWSFKIGVGFGMGYISADGIVKLEGPVVSLKPIDGKGFDTSIGILVEYTYKNWVFQAKEYAPSATINGVDFKIELPTFIVGYRFEF